MKKTTLLLAFLVFFIGYHGFAKGIFDKPKDKKKTEVSNAAEADIKKISEDLNKINGEIIKINGDIKDIKEIKKNQENVNQVTTERILVTPQIVQFLLKNNVSLDGLKFFPSNRFSLEIYEKKETDEIKKDNNMIILNSPNNVNEPTNRIEISKDSEGTCTNIPEPDKGSKLQITYQLHEKKINLLFGMNSQQNSYELFEANDVTKNYSIKFSEPILLYVSGQDNRKAQAVPVDFVRSTEQSPKKPSTGNEQSSQRTTTNNDRYSYTDSAIFSKKIVSTGSLKSDKVLSYVRDKNPSLSHMDIAVINSYFNLSGSINVDIAIAQMLYYTDFFKRIDRVKTCNFGCLSDTPPDFYGDFKGIVTDGIKAHIQHLRAYAHEPPGLQEKIIDPRYDLAYRKGSKEINFREVFNNWSADPEYGQKIINILQDLYKFSNAM